jgi:hypothetical protein
MNADRTRTTPSQERDSARRERESKTLRCGRIGMSTPSSTDGARQGANASNERRAWAPVRRGASGPQDDHQSDDGPGPR